MVANKSISSPVYLQISEQITNPSTPIKLDLKVKYFTDSVEHDLIQDVTRTLFYLQVKDKIVSSEWHCPSETCLLLASYACQAKYSNYNENEAEWDNAFLERLLTQSYLAENSIDVVKTELARLYERHKHIQRSEAIVAYLVEAQKLTHFGTSQPIAVSNKRGTRMKLLLGSKGLAFYLIPDVTRQNPVVSFGWDEIGTISQDHTSIAIKSKEDDSCQELVFEAGDEKKARNTTDWMNGYQQLLEQLKQPEPPEVEYMRKQADSDRMYRTNEHRKLIASLKAKSETALELVNDESRHHLNRSPNQCAIDQRSWSEIVDKIVELENRLDNQARLNDQLTLDQNVLQEHRHQLELLRVQREADHELLVHLKRQLTTESQFLHTLILAKNINKSICDEEEAMFIVADSHASSEGQGQSSVMTLPPTPSSDDFPVINDGSDSQFLHILRANEKKSIVGDGGDVGARVKSINCDTDRKDSQSDKTGQSSTSLTLPPPPDDLQGVTAGKLVDKKESKGTGYPRRPPVAKLPGKRMKQLKSWLGCDLVPSDDDNFLDQPQSSKRVDLTDDSKLIGKKFQKIVSPVSHQLGDRGEKAIKQLNETSQGHLPSNQHLSDQSPSPQIIKHKCDNRESDEIGQSPSSTLPPPPDDLSGVTTNETIGQKGENNPKRPPVAKSSEKRMRQLKSWFGFDLVPSDDDNFIDESQSSKRVDLTKMNSKKSKIASPTFGRSKARNRLDETSQGHLPSNHRSPEDELSRLDKTSQGQLLSASNQHSLNQSPSPINIKHVRDYRNTPPPRPTFVTTGSSNRLPPKNCNESIHTRPVHGDCGKENFRATTRFIDDSQFGNRIASTRPDQIGSADLRAFIMEQFENHSSRRLIRPGNTKRKVDTFESL